MPATVRQLVIVDMRGDKTYLNFDSPSSLLDLSLAAATKAVDIAVFDDAADRIAPRIEELREEFLSLLERLNLASDIHVDGCIGDDLRRTA